MTVLGVSVTWKLQNFPLKIATFANTKLEFAKVSKLLLCYWNKDHDKNIFFH